MIFIYRASATTKRFGSLVEMWTMSGLKQRYCSYCSQERRFSSSALRGCAMHAVCFLSECNSFSEKSDDHRGSGACHPRSAEAMTLRVFDGRATEQLERIRKRKTRRAGGKCLNGSGFRWKSAISGKPAWKRPAISVWT